MKTISTIWDFVNAFHNFDLEQQKDWIECMKESLMSIGEYTIDNCKIKPCNIDTGYYVTIYNFQTISEKYIFVLYFNEVINKYCIMSSNSYNKLENDIKITSEILGLIEHR